MKLAKYICLLVVAGCFCQNATAQSVVDSELHKFKVEVLVENLNSPWAMQFMPDGGFLITERPGSLIHIKADGSIIDIKNLPQIDTVGQGGLHDVLLDSDFAINGRIYLCYAAGGFSGFGTELASAVLGGDRLSQVKVLFEAEPKSQGGRHFGCRIVMGKDDHLYLSLGDRGNRKNPQNTNTHPGSIIRITKQGEVPLDNPFLQRPDHRPELYSIGNRNPQGMALHPESGEVWAHEHGPQGGDELNIIRAGNNYGWPVITYGANYGSGSKIGDGTHKKGMQQPIYYWVPSIAPSGMSFYRGKAFPRWKNSLFVGSLKFRLLVRLEIQGNKVVSEERMLQDQLGRIRDVRTGPDGLVYLLTDSGNGQLVRLRPVD